MSWIADLRARRATPSPHDDFGSDAYQRHNTRRQEHLASLRIPVAERTVLEVGAGTGDHSGYFLDRGCTVTITEGRRENLDILERRYPGADIRQLDLENPVPLEGAPFDVVYCYGLLYHLSDPARALEYLAGACGDLLLLETCVSFGDDFEVNVVEEDERSATQAVSGRGCRPTRPWVLRELQHHFAFVYVPRTQPNHEQFPIDWSLPTRHQGLSRAVFVASRQPIDDEAFLSDLPAQQVRHP